MMVKFQRIHLILFFHVSYMFFPFGTEECPKRMDAVMSGNSVLT